MTITYRLERALQRLNELIDEGVYFNPAIGAVSAQFGLTETEYQTIVNLYDAQG
jgi:hypothetical protein